MNTKNLNDKEKLKELRSFFGRFLDRFAILLQLFQR